MVQGHRLSGGDVRWTSATRPLAKRPKSAAANWSADDRAPPWGQAHRGALLLGQRRRDRDARPHAGVGDLLVQTGDLCRERLDRARIGRGGEDGRCCMKPLAGEVVWPAFLLTLCSQWLQPPDGAR